MCHSTTGSVFCNGPNMRHARTPSVLHPFHFTTPHAATAVGTALPPLLYANGTFVARLQLVSHAALFTGTAQPEHATRFGVPACLPPPPHPFCANTHSRDTARAHHCVSTLNALVRILNSAVSARSTIRHYRSTCMHFLLRTPRTLYNRLQYLLRLPERRLNVCGEPFAFQRPRHAAMPVDSLAGGSHSNAP